MSSFQKTANEEALNQIYKVSYAATIGQILLLFTVSYLFFGLIPLNILAIGVSTHLLIYSIRSYVTWRYFKISENNKYKKIQAFWFYFYAVSVFLAGLAWGLSFILLTYEHIPVEYPFFMTAVIIGLGGAAITTLGTDLSIYLLFTIPMLSSYFIWFCFQSDKIHNVSAVLLLLIIFFYRITVQRYSEFFHLSIKKRNKALRAQREMVERLSKASELKDNETGMHVKRMRYYSYLLSKVSGQEEKITSNILLASSMHDAGKIGIPDSILLKNGKLTEEEWEIMKSHTLIGQDLLKDSESELIQLSESIALTHHEKFDGSGYPKGLKGEEIPIEGRIVAIADVYDALVSKRPYKEPWSNEEAFAYIQEEAGRSFDPELVKHFLNLKGKIVAYQKAHQD